MAKLIIKNCLKVPDNREKENTKKKKKLKMTHVYKKAVVVVYVCFRHHILKCLNKSM